MTLHSPTTAENGDCWSAFLIWFDGQPARFHLLTWAAVLFFFGAMLCLDLSSGEYEVDELAALKTLNTMKKDYTQARVVGQGYRYDGNCFSGLRNKSFFRCRPQREIIHECRWTHSPNYLISHVTRQRLEAEYVAQTGKNDCKYKHRSGEQKTRAHDPAACFAACHQAKYFSVNSHGGCHCCTALTSHSHGRQGYMKVSSPSSPGPGSCVVVGYQAGSSQDVGVLLLQNIDAGVKLHLTDDGVLAVGGLRRKEGVRSLTVGSGGLSAGTVLKLLDFEAAEGSTALSSFGDQVIVFTGTTDSPTYLCALNTHEGVWQEHAMSANQSAIPPSLEDGSTAVALNTTKTAVYVGTRTGTAAQLRLLINNRSNWQNGITDIPTAFTVQGNKSSAGKPAPNGSLSARRLKGHRHSEGHAAIYCEDRYEPWLLVTLETEADKTERCAFPFGVESSELGMKSMHWEEAAHYIDIHPVGSNISVWLEHSNKCIIGYGSLSLLSDRMSVLAIDDNTGARIAQGLALFTCLAVAGALYVGFCESPGFGENYMPVPSRESSDPQSAVAFAEGPKQPVSPATCPSTELATADGDAL